MAHHEDSFDDDRMIRRLATIPEHRERVSARLARVCKDMPKDEFDRFVDDVVLLEFRYEDR